MDLQAPEDLNEDDDEPSDEEVPGLLGDEGDPERATLLGGRIHHKRAPQADTATVHIGNIPHEAFNEPDGVLSRLGW